MANPIQQGLKRHPFCDDKAPSGAAMANPIQQGLKHHLSDGSPGLAHAAMANPIQQGLKPMLFGRNAFEDSKPQWLIQYNKD